MSRNLYFQEMRETSSLVVSSLRDVVARLVEDTPELRHSMDLMVERRTNAGRLLLRPYLVRLGFELLSDMDWRDVLKACVGAELLNISTYQANLAFDRKIRSEPTNEANNQFACAMLTYDASIRCFSESCAEIRPEVLPQILSVVHSTNDDIYRGQYLDMNVLSLCRLISDGDIPDYLALYTRRARLIGGSLIACCLRVGALLGGSNQRMQATLQAIGEAVGTGGQITNDVSDFIPPHLLSLNGSAAYRYAYSDLHNGRLTFPLYDLWLKSPESRHLLRDIADGRRLIEKDGETVFGLLSRIGTFDRTRRLVHSHYKMARRLIHPLPERRAKRLIGVLSSSLPCNKYWATIREYLAHGLNRKPYADHSERDSRETFSNQSQPVMLMTSALRAIRGRNKDAVNH